MGILSINANSTECASIDLVNNTTLENINITSFPYDYTFSENDSISLTANDQTGYNFSQWDIDNSFPSTDNPVTIIAIDNTNVNAIFVPDNPNPPPSVGDTLNIGLYNAVLNQHEDEITQVAESGFINQSTVSFQTGIWNTEPKDVEYLLRLNSAEKWVIDQMLLASSIITLIDANRSYNGSAWINNVSYSWNMIDSTKIWELTINLTFVQ